MKHDLRFDHRAPFTLPICRVCRQTITSERWAADEACPGPLSCEPPMMHIYLDGRRVCECGLMNDAEIIEVFTGRPVSGADAR